MIIKQFKLRAWGYKKYFRVIVYDRPKSLRKAALRFVDDSTGNGYHDSLGVCQPYEYISMKPDGKEVIKDDIGIIRLCKNHLYSEVITHEVGHAAMWQYRIETKGKAANFGKDCSEKEEEYCYILGRLSADMNKKLYKHKLWGAK